MSADLEAKLAVAMAKIAELDEKLSSAKKAPAPLSMIDPRQLAADPIGTMVRAGIDVEHVTKHTVANAMGEQAPAHLKEYVRSGQQLSSTVQTIDAKLETLGRRIDEVVGGTRSERFQKLAADKSKYPHLATALAADPTLFEVGQADDPVEYATKMEAQLAKLAPALGAKPASASVVAADTTDSAQAQNAKPAPMASAVNGDPPIPQKVPTGALDADGKRALRDEIVRQYSSQE